MTRHLLVIGAQRCATTYVQRLLDTHPDITMARPARPEPKVFLRPDSTSRGLDWYRDTYFAHATGEFLLGEKSTSYLESRPAAERAATVLGAAAIVVMLRDPVERAVSNWRFSTASGLEDRPLLQALTDNLAGARAWDHGATSVSPFAYLERGRYAEHLGPWWSAFPGAVHVRFLEELVGCDAAITDLYRALGVDPGTGPVAPEHPVNESDGPPPELEPDVVDRLREYFRPGDALLAERLGRDLPWSGR